MSAKKHAEINISKQKICFFNHPKVKNVYCVLIIFSFKYKKILSVGPDGEGLSELGVQ